MSLAAVIGCGAALQTAEGLSVGVQIIDARRCYGRVDYQVQPLKGSGRGVGVGGAGEVPE
jgi:hypothetical protein